MRKLTILFAFLTLSAGLAQAQETPEPNTLPTLASNQIIYRSSDHQKITPKQTDVFNATYDDAQSTYNTEADYGIITFDGKLTTIGESAFDGITKLTTIVWPNTVTHIGKDAFFGCTQLSYINLHEGLKIIGENAFYKCAGMTELTLPSTVTNIGDYAFERCQNLTKLTIKAGSIGKDAFEYCTNLSSVDLQEGVTSIGEFAFYGCTGLTSVSIKAGSIAGGAFNGCTGLTSVSIKAGSIAGGAFKNCTNLSSITIGDGVTSIENNAFSGCTNVTSVKFLGVLVLDGGSLNSIGTAESPVNLQIPSTWLANDKPVNSTTPWHGGYFSCEYIDPIKEFLGEMGEPCEDCPTIEVTKGTKTIKLYNPDKVNFIKVSTTE